MATTPATHTRGSHTRGSQGEYSHRPMTWSTRGMVGAGTQLTAQTGMHVLWQGGNAVDAAVATALAAGVLEPTASYSLGGEVAFLFYDAATGKVRSVVGQGWVPEKATMDLYLERWGEIPFGVLSTTVPGVISALLAMLAEYGTMSFSQVAESALSFARDGFPTYQLLNHGITGWRDNIGKYPDSARVYLPGGKPPALGSIFKQTDLANTLSMMVQEEESALGRGLDRAAAIQAARDLFYKGDPAHRMVKALQGLGGLYSNDDFGDYTSPWEEPVSTTYRGYEIFTNRTWTQGICLLQALNILEGDDLASMGHNSVQAIHLQVEALKLAMADRERYVGDTDFQDVPVAGLLSKEYARLRRSLIDPNTALADYPSGDPRGLQAVAGPNRAPAAPPGPGDPGRRLRWHHLPGDDRCAGQHGVGHAQHFFRVVQGNGPGRHGHSDKQPGLLFLAGPGQRQRAATPQTPPDNPLHVHHPEGRQAVHDPGHSRRRQPGAKRSSGAEQHHRLWPEPAGGR